MSGTHRARKRFGQHFLVDPGSLQSIVDAIAPRSEETLVEIGPGQGALTEPLLLSGAALHAVELDRDLVLTLGNRYSQAERFTLHEADALKFDFRQLGERLRIVGNLPYNISTPILFHLLEAMESIRDMHFMLQKEVVERMAAEPDSKRYGRLTVMLRALADVEALFDVPPDAFDPPPKVMSAVVRVLPNPERAASVREPAVLRRIVTAAFSKRRKTLRNALSGVVAQEALETCDIDATMRAENIPVEQWITLANHMASNEAED